MKEDSVSRPGPRPEHLCADAQKRSPDVVPAPGNGTVEAIISSLCAQVERAEDKAERWREEVLRRRKEAAEQEERINALTDALRPFAEIGAGIGEGWDDKRRAYTLNLAPLQIRHLRRAVALVAARASGPRVAPQAEVTDPGRNPESSTEMEARKNR